MGTLPKYLSISRQRIREKISQSLHELESCRLCPRQCGVNRRRNETGICRTGYRAVVASYGPHFGEENVLVGHSGSGTIFFSYCNLLCNFCQNYDISHHGAGETKSAEALAQIMIYLQGIGCHNINLVTPSHVVAQILQAIDIAIDLGLTIPLVYNSSAYDGLRALQLVDGLIDIYMPDIKFFDSELAEKTCDAGDYPNSAKTAVREMHRQVGDLQIDENGIARQGLLVRHLVLPEDLAGSRDIMRFISQELSEHTYVNIMGQYRPCGQAVEIGPLRRRPSSEEIQQAVDAAKHEGLYRIDGLH